MITLIGDSLSAAKNAPGALFLAEAAKRKKTTPRRNAKVGRSVVGFTEKEPLTVASEFALRPSTVYLFLGTNDIGTPQARLERAFATLQEAARVVRVPLVAIGPPSFPPSAKSAAGVPLQKGSAEVYRALAATGLSVIDSRPLTRDILTPGQGRSQDGIHFAASGAKKYAARLVSAALPRRVNDLVLALLMLGGLWFLSRD
jgi:lysophospholipase L1-like esterase